MLLCSQGLNTGELFVVRNVANLCVNTDHSLLAALAYAVNVLEVSLHPIGGEKQETKPLFFICRWMLTKMRILGVFFAVLNTFMRCGCTVFTHHSQCSSKH